MTLELFDETGEEGVPTGDTATLTKANRITYKGNGVKEVLAPYLRDGSPVEVFELMSGWSNGYVSLRERRD